MTIILKIEHTDIQTAPIGHNFQITTTQGIDMVFSPEAMDELMNDWNQYKIQNSK